MYRNAKYMRKDANKRNSLSDSLIGFQNHTQCLAIFKHINYTGNVQLKDMRN